MLNKLNFIKMYIKTFNTQTIMYAYLYTRTYKHCNIYYYVVVYGKQAYNKYYN